MTNDEVLRHPLDDDDNDRVEKWDFNQDGTAEHAAYLAAASMTQDWNQDLRGKEDDAEVLERIALAAFHASDLLLKWGHRLRKLAIEYRKLAPLEKLAYAEGGKDE